MNLKEEIREVQDYPKEGISFKNITTLINNPKALNYVIDSVVHEFKEKSITKVVGLEARDFIFGNAIVANLKVGFVPIRKRNKLPAIVFSETYELEYGTDVVEMHVDAVNENDVVLIHDDLLAAGGSALAALNLVKQRGAAQIYFSFIYDLEFIATSKKDEILKYDNQIPVKYS